MTKDQIQVGGFYAARISGNFVTVRVDSIDEVDHFAYKYGQRTTKQVTRYNVTNLKTGRQTVFKSAAKFRRPVQNAQL